MAVHPISQTAAHLLHRSKKLVLKLNRRYQLHYNTETDNTGDNNAQSMYQQGEIYLFGKCGESRNEKRAFEYFKRAATMNHTQAQGVLAFCYEFGLGVEKDFKQAELHYISAAESGNGLAQARLAFLRKYGRPSVRIDRSEADMWQQKDKLGVCLQLGIGCEKNEELAFQYFRQAAEQDHLAAMYHLANALEKGIGCEIDLQAATIWFEKAASSGCRTSCERLKRLLVKECLGQDDHIASQYIFGYYAAAA
ncbi:9329_t:CDS:2 [Ambispora gerdemannii]|uniref:9329_t:CDS:1 n=1 Tax=Ambispora gerdemannii TaxID=144530 RepID=A0A9N9AYJ1_9GLOM|nr:9329_t:CDS:2 [Ambispora gerdemannii]